MLKEKAKLAVFGGDPIRNERLYYGRQSIEDDDVEAVVDALRSPFITQGPQVSALEEALCSYTGAAHSVVASNGTAALHLSCLAAGVGPGDEIITTPLTFAASANCALFCGATPVFADVDHETYNIDPGEIEKAVTSRTKAVVAVDFAGVPVDVDAIRQICDEYGLYFIEDAAHSIGSEYKGKRVGSLADFTTFSFHPVKTITSGEGGAVLTQSIEMHDRVRLLGEHGITKDETKFEHKSVGDWYYEMQELGFNYRMTDFQAALAHSQLKKIDRFAARRSEIVDTYNNAFSVIPGIILQKTLPGANPCRHLYTIQIDPHVLACSRREFYDALAAEGIQPQVHYIPVPALPYYRRRGYDINYYPVAKNIYEHILSLPLYPMLTDADVCSVIRAVEKVVAWYTLS